MELMEELYPKRPLVLARELTKVHEEFIRGAVQEVRAEVSERGGVKGEVVLVLGGDEGPPVYPRAELVREVYAALVRQGKDPRAAMRELARLLGIPKRRLQRLIFGKGGNDAVQGDDA